MKQAQRLVAIAAGFLILAALPSQAAPTVAWTDQHDGGATFVDDGFCLLMAPDGNLIVGGESTDTIAGSDMLIRKLDRDSGATIWSYRQAAVDENDMDVSGMVWDGAGNLLIGGTRLGCFG